MNTNNKQPYFKSEVAFFFLFFLYGTSIGTRQQGISYNKRIMGLNDQLDMAKKARAEFTNALDNIGVKNPKG